MRKENQQRRMRERSNARGLTASYLEPDRYEDDEEALEQSLLEMKKHYKKGLAKSTYMQHFFTFFCLLIRAFTKITVRYCGACSVLTGVEATHLRTSPLPLHVRHYNIFVNLCIGRLGDVYSDQESEEEGISGGLESDDDSAENSADKGAGISENDSTRQRKHSFEEPVVKKKRNIVIAESDEDESD